MSTQVLLVGIALASAGVITALAQGQPADPKRTPGVQAGQDPNRAAFIAANCKTPPAPPAARGGGGGGGGRAGGAAPAAATATEDYTVAAIPGVIAAGARWKVVWEDKGNNADGPVGMDDGSLWIAQNDKSDVVRIDKTGTIVTRRHASLGGRFRVRLWLERIENDRLDAGSLVAGHRLAVVAVALGRPSARRP